MNQTPTTGASDTTYWRSLGQLENSEEFQQILAREFPEGITEAPDEVSRRGFLGAVAASVALAGMASCRKPETKILPFTKRPEGFKPGIAQQYATTLTRNGFGIGVLAKSNDGRPTKLDGNPSHPSCPGGGSDMQLQAELLQLYDPNRSREARNPHKASHAHEDDGHGGHGEHGGDHHEVDVWMEIYDWLEGDAGQDLLNKQGQGLHVVMPPTTSPSLLAAVGRMKSGSFPKARFH
ncbi:MAG: TAT-variant-translocated molybdopterin oxidoreductase, partial [Planctomycetes bacterium]|nr:TAT-variant-translocated molybdopterin oxidoreductase [Planctomycetota bacterium]